MPSDDFYRASFPPHAPFVFQGDHTRHLSSSSSSSSSLSSLASSSSSSLSSPSSSSSLFYAHPGDSPPNHNLSNPALKSHYRQTHIRARVAASPYPRDTESVHSSSSETEDMAMYLGHPAQSDYAPNPMYASPAMLGGSPDLNTAGAFGRMTLSPDHALEKLAANVRAATTTSASDRAKQIFVQAWCVTPRSPCLFLLFFFLRALVLTSCHLITCCHCHYHTLYRFRCPSSCTLWTLG